MEDDVIVEFIFNQLEAKDPDPRKMLIVLAPFLNDEKAKIFMGELWKLLDSAQKTSSPVNTENGKNSEIIKGLKADLYHANKEIEKLKLQKEVK